MKFALVSEALPPSTTSPGQAGMIRRLLAPLDPSAYCLISRVDYNAEPYAAAPERLPARYYHLTAGGLSTGRSERRRGPFRRALSVPARIATLVGRARQIAAIVRAEQCSAIVASPDRVGDLPTAYIASRLTGVRFHPYFFDYYSAWFNRGLSGLITRRLEPFVLKRAAGIIVPNEGLRDTLARRYGVEPTVIHNACDLSVYDGPQANARALREELRVVFTGAIYDAHYDGLRALLLVLRSRRGARLHVYTPAPQSVLSERGLDESVVYHGHISSSAVPGVQQAADLLFLPLAFESPFPEVIRTSAPAKMGEYLAAARPIIVRAPADSYAAQYVRRHECGLVVSDRDPAPLAEALDRLTGDADLRHRLCENAWRRAHEDFDLTQARVVFLRCLSGSQRSS